MAITAQEMIDRIEKAKAELGLKLVRRCYHRNGNECCPLTLLYVKHAKESKPNEYETTMKVFREGEYANFIDASDVTHHVLDWAGETFGDWWKSGFVRGFDGREAHYGNCSGSFVDEYNAGHRVGVEVGEWFDKEKASA